MSSNNSRASLPFDCIVTNDGLIDHAIEPNAQEIRHTMYFSGDLEEILGLKKLLEGDTESDDGMAIAVQTLEEVAEAQDE